MLVDKCAHVEVVKSDNQGQSVIGTVSLSLMTRMYGMQIKTITYGYIDLINDE